MPPRPRYPRPRPRQPRVGFIQGAYPRLRDVGPYVIDGFGFPIPEGEATFQNGEWVRSNWRYGQTYLDDETQEPQ